MAYQENILEIYKTEYAKYEKTREIQWKINIAIWTLISAVAYAFMKRDIAASNISSSHVALWALLLVSIGICLVHAIFLRRVQRSMDNSMIRLSNIASYLCDKSVLEDVNQERMMWQSVERGAVIKMKGWVTLQAAVTVLLVIIAWVVSGVY